MVTHFRNLAAHRNGVLSVYRALLRHTSNLKQLEDVTEAQSVLMTKTVKRQFKHQKPMMSTAKVRTLLLKANDIEQRLRMLYTQFDTTVLENLLKECDDATIKKSNQTHKLRNRFGQPMKRDLDNQQDLETQQITNYVNHYVRIKQRLGQLPRTIDPIMLEEIIKPEALHNRAMMDIKRHQERIARGPYKVHVASSNGVSFVRGPWRQAKRVSPMILYHVKKEQEFFDYNSHYDNMKWLYRSENQWENLTNTSDGTQWGKSVTDDLKMLSRNIDQRKKFFKSYARNVLPDQIKTSQAKSDFIHENIKRRFNSLMNEAKDSTAFDSLLGKQTLRELVKKHKFT
ncbi:CYFA0S22e01508g1_1 [Cyberlindnera fabianii]|uniref:CYFA0S22e01508g1_1 n=1 Tax=Cyberlindnera fabianii TaxID=36022 RepID=A0A061BGV0_CYBFA|nr:CYFA0S22e01508g1_1 [Cyberlindnera fabianii]